MLQADCIAVGSHRDHRIIIKRVVEYLRYDLVNRNVEITFDLFVTNPEAMAVPIRLLHRGGLDAVDRTDTIIADKGHTQRFIRLHNENEYDRVELDTDHRTISLLENCIESAGEQKIAYHLPAAPLEVKRLTGGAEAGDVPFTLWETNPIPPGHSCYRIQLSLQGASYDRQIQKGSFYICGGQTLLGLIKNCDLTRYTGEGLAFWSNQFTDFVDNYPSNPIIYEIIIEGGQGIQLPEKVTSQTPSVRPMLIPHDLRANTIWFTVQNDPSFSIDGEFVLYVSMGNAASNPFGSIMDALCNVINNRTIADCSKSRKAH